MGKERKQNISRQIKYLGGNSCAEGLPVTEWILPSRANPARLGHPGFYLGHPPQAKDLLRQPRKFG
jgi:hypothetical protein